MLTHAGTRTIQQVQEEKRGENRALGSSSKPKQSSFSWLLVGQKLPGRPDEQRRFCPRSCFQSLRAQCVAWLARPSKKNTDESRTITNGVSTGITPKQHKSHLERSCGGQLSLPSRFPRVPRSAPKKHHITNRGLWETPWGYC